MADPEVLSRPAPPPDLVLRYGPGPDQVADVRLPATAGPLVVVIHGGFWKRAYDRAHTGPMAADLAGRGYAVAAIEYRRVGQSGDAWPGILDDVARALDELPELLAARTAAVDVDRVVLLGHSAGGHLALWAAARHRLPAGAPWRLPAPPPIRGVVALAAVSDLVAAHRLGLGGGAVAGLLGGGPADQPDRYALADPRPLLPYGVPAVLVHGELDDIVPVQLSRDFVAAAGDEATLRELAGVEHFGVIDPSSAAWPAVVAAVAGFAG